MIDLDSERSVPLIDPEGPIIWRGEKQLVGRFSTIKNNLVVVNLLANANVGANLPTDLTDEIDFIHPTYSIGPDGLFNEVNAFSLKYGGWSIINLEKQRVLKSWPNAEIPGDISSIAEQANARKVIFSPSKKQVAMKRVEPGMVSLLLVYDVI